MSELNRQITARTLADPTGSEIAESSNHQITYKTWQGVSEYATASFEHKGDRESTVDEAYKLCNQAVQQSLISGKCPKKLQVDDLKGLRSNLWQELEGALFGGLREDESAPVEQITVSASAGFMKRKGPGMRNNSGIDATYPQVDFTVQRGSHTATERSVDPWGIARGPLSPEGDTIYIGWGKLHSYKDMSIVGEDRDKPTIWENKPEFDFDYGFGHGFEEKAGKTKEETTEASSAHLKGEESSLGNPPGPTTAELTLGGDSLPHRPSELSTSMSFKRGISEQEARSGQSDTRRSQRGDNRYDDGDRFGDWARLNYGDDS